MQKPNFLCAVTSSSSFMKLFIILLLCLIFMPIGHTDVSFLPLLNIRYLLLSSVLIKNPSFGFDACKKNEVDLNATKSFMFLLVSAYSGLKIILRLIMIMY